MEEPKQIAVLREHFASIKQTLVRSRETLISVADHLYQAHIIDSTVRHSINVREPSGAENAAETLMVHVSIMVEQNTDYFKTVLGIFSMQHFLKEVAKKMEITLSLKMSTKQPEPAARPGSDPETGNQGTSNVQPPDEDVLVDTTIKEAYALKKSFESFIESIMETSKKIDVGIVKLRVVLLFQTSTLHPTAFFFELERLTSTEGVIRFLIFKRIVGYLNVKVLKIAFERFKEMATTINNYEQQQAVFFRRHSLLNIASAFRQEDDLVPVAPSHLHKIKFILKGGKWKNKSFYQWSEVMENLQILSKSLMIQDIQTNCISLTYAVLPFFLPTIVKQLSDKKVDDYLKTVDAEVSIDKEVTEIGLLQDTHIQNIIKLANSFIEKAMASASYSLSAPDHHCESDTGKQNDVILEQKEGFKEELFVSPPPDHVRCIECKQASREPQQTSCCGKIICKVCWPCDDLKECPYCHIANFSLMLDKRTINTINALEVQCINCQWQGKFSEYANHVAADEKHTTNEQVNDIKEQYEEKIRHLKEDHRQQLAKRDAECTEKVDSFSKQLNEERESSLFSQAIVFGGVYPFRLLPEWCFPEQLSTQIEDAQAQPVFRVIDQFSEKKNRVYTEPFYTAVNGHKVRLSVLPNKTGDDFGKIATFIHLMKGPNDENLSFPLLGTFDVHLLNWKEDKGHKKQSIFFTHETPIEYSDRVFNESGMAEGWGLDEIMNREELAISHPDENFNLEDKLCFRVKYTSHNQSDDGGSEWQVPEWCDESLLSSDTVPCIRTLKNYSGHKQNSSVWSSTAFYTWKNGYKLLLSVKPSSKFGTHVSLYLYLMKGDHDDTLQWPINRVQVTVKFLNWISDNNHKKFTLDPRYAHEKCRQRVREHIKADSGWGYNVIKHELLENQDPDCKYVLNDKVCFEIAEAKLVDT